MAKSIKLRGWRKIAAATWRRPSDPQIYGDLEIDAAALLSYVEAARRLTGAKVTITHLAGKAVAYALGQCPDLNVRLYRGRAVPRETVDVFFIVSSEAGEELTGVKVERADEKPVVAIARELAERAGRIHEGEDLELGRTKKMLSATPTWGLSWMFKLAAWVAIDRDWHLPSLGMPRQTFGSTMISSVGMFGVGHAYAPLSPYYRVPFLTLVSEVAPKPVAVEGQVVVRPILTLSATMDHRYIDGFHAARLARHVKAYCADPTAFEPPFDEVSAQAAKR